MLVNYKASQITSLRLFTDSGKLSYKFNSLYSSISATLRTQQRSQVSLCNRWWLKQKHTRTKCKDNCQLSTQSQLESILRSGRKSVMNRATVSSKLDSILMNAQDQASQHPSIKEQEAHHPKS